MYLPWPTFLHPMCRTSTMEGTGTHEGGGKRESSKDKLGRSLRQKTSLCQPSPSAGRSTPARGISLLCLSISFPSLLRIHARLLRNAQSPLGAEDLRGNRLCARSGKPGQPGWGAPSGQVCNGGHRTRACQGGY